MLTNNQRPDAPAVDTHNLSIGFGTLTCLRIGKGDINSVGHEGLSLIEFLHWLYPKIGATTPLTHLDLLLDIRGQHELVDLYKDRIVSTVMATGGSLPPNPFTFLRRLPILAILLIVIQDRFYTLPSALHSLHHIDIIQGSEMGSREHSAWWKAVDNTTTLTLDAIINQPPSALRLVTVWSSPDSQLPMLKEPSTTLRSKGFDISIHELCMYVVSSMSRLSTL